MTRRILWQAPALHREGDLDIHRKVTWLELFFDLFFVVLVARLSHDLAGDPTGPGMLTFLALFVPVWWVWIGITIYNERFETEGLENRVLTFLLMLPVTGMAAFSHHGLEENFRGFALSYVAARAIITLRWLDATLRAPEFRPVGIRFTAGFTTGLFCALAAAFVDGPGRNILFGLSLAVDLLTPLTTVRLQARLPRLSTSKLPERYGLFVLIVLGETIVAVVNGLADRQGLTAGLALSAGLGIGIGFGLWWLYFDYVNRRPFRPSVAWTMTWSYLHLPLVMGIVLTGTGVLHVLEHDGALGVEARRLIGGGLAAVLILMSAIELTLRRAPDEPTHPVWSPLLKTAAGLAAGMLAVAEPIVDAPVLLAALMALLAVPMAYGAWVWFRQDLGTPAGAPLD